MPLARKQLLKLTSTVTCPMTDSRDRDHEVFDLNVSDPKPEPEVGPPTKHKLSIHPAESLCSIDLQTVSPNQLLSILHTSF